MTNADIYLLPTELGSTCLPHSQASLLTPHCGEAKHSVYWAGTKQGEQAAHAQKTQTLHDFQARVFKDIVRGGDHRRVISSWTFF